MDLITNLLSSLGTWPKFLKYKKNYFVSIVISEFTNLYIRRVHNIKIKCIIFVLTLEWLGYESVW
jgi:hypothetical protein